MGDPPGYWRPPEGAGKIAQRFVGASVVGLEAVSPHGPPRAHTQGGASGARAWADQLAHCRPTATARFLARNELARGIGYGNRRSVMGLRGPRGARGPRGDRLEPRDLKTFVLSCSVSVCFRTTYKSLAVRLSLGSCVDIQRLTNCPTFAASTVTAANPEAPQ